MTARNPRTDRPGGDPAAALASGERSVRAAGLRGVAAAVPATLAGAWVAARLSRR